MATEADFEDVDEDAAVMFEDATHAREFEFVLTRGHVQQVHRRGRRSYR